METKNSLMFAFVKKYNSRKVKLTPPTFKFDLCFVVKSIVYKIHTIGLRHTEVRERLNLMPPPLHKDHTHTFIVFVIRIVNVL